MIRRREKPEDPATIVTKRIEIEPEVIVKLRDIVAMCKDVFCELGKGFAESVYEQALCIELQQRNIQYVTQETIPLYYKERFIGNIRLDVLLHSWLPFIFELKAVSSTIQTDERWQVVRYMSRKSIPYGAVVNFNQSISKGLEISFLVEHDGRYYILDLDTCEGKLLKDACPE